MTYKSKSLSLSLSLSLFVWLRIIKYIYQQVFKTDNNFRLKTNACLARNIKKSFFIIGQVHRECTICRKDAKVDITSKITPTFTQSHPSASDISFLFMFPISCFHMVIQDKFSSVSLPLSLSLFSPSLSLYIYIYIKVGDRSQGQPEGTLFNSYCTNVEGRVQLLSLNYIYIIIIMSCRQHRYP